MRTEAIARDVQDAPRSADRASGQKPSEYRASDIRKSFGAVPVLDGITTAFRPSRIHTMMGENGAGKSTLFKILAGIVAPSGGTLALDGEAVVFGGPSDAHARGIILVPQEPMLMPELSVAEAMFVGQLPLRSGFPRRVDWRAVRRRAADALASLGLDIDPGARAGTLSIAQAQQVECAKALLRGCRTILFDEPTSPLTAHEVERLFAIMRRLRDDGCTLGFISHRMDEVLAISDDISILRDGMLVETASAPEFDRTRLLSAMVGRPMQAIPRRTLSTATDQPVLSVRGLAHAGRFRDVGFTLHRGEILGLAGLVGAGRTEIAETIFGLRRRDAGTVELDGAPITGLRPDAIIRNGLVYAPEDRARHGAVLPMTIAENLSSGRLDAMRKRFGLIDRGDEDARSAAVVRQFRVRCAGIDQRTRELSGGNQQKVVFGKWMGLAPKVAILDEPTRGVDVGAKDEIHELIETLARDGMAFLVISSETEELVRLCDRVLSIYEGRIVSELAGDAITLERVTRSYVGAAASAAA